MFPLFYRTPVCRHHHEHDPHGHHGDHDHHEHGNGLETHRSGGREIKVVRRVLAANDVAAGRNRDLFAAKKIFVLNVMSSPGSGKTTTLIQVLNNLKMPCAVIVGDICTTKDADRLATTGAPVVQINTDEFGGDCHLAAHVIEKALDGIDLDRIHLLIVENIGNLVCPAEFDIGEDKRVVVLSVTEGEDKPAKYPLMFRICDALLLNKMDLLPYLDYDLAAARRSIAQIHPGMPVFEMSAKTGQGLDGFVEWLKEQVSRKRSSS